MSEQEGATAVSSARRRSEALASLRGVLQLWWLVVLFAVLGGAAAAGVSALQTPLYRSTTTLYVTVGSEDGAQQAYQGTLASQQRVLSYAELVTSEEVLRRARDTSGLQLTTEQMTDAISATAKPGTVLVSISAELPDADDAARLANGLGEAMVEYVEDLETTDKKVGPTAKVTVVTPAVIEPDAVSPLYGRNIAIGVLGGLLLGAIAAHLWRRFDVRIRTSEDLREAGSHSVLGEIPEDSELGSRSLVDFSSGASAAAEAYRKLRTNLAFVQVDGSVRCLVVTSPNVAEGKTTTAINLAAAFAESGKRSIVIDADLRRPMVAKRLGISGSVGVTDIVRGGVRLEEVVQGTSVNGLFAITAGELPPNPAEFLGFDAVGRLVEELKNHFDVVVVDSAPILPVTDSVVAAQWCDGVIIVAKAGKTRIPDLERAVDQLAGGHAAVFGSVLNGAKKMSKSSYAYYGSD